jgi:uncharacterized protein YcbX
MSIEVSGLRVYPVKSLRPMMPASVAVEIRGLKNDRRWMIVDDKGKFRTRREMPALARINAVAEHDRLILSKDGVGEVCVPLVPEGKSISVQVWGSKPTGTLVSPIADEWLTQAIGESSRLVYMPETARRRINPKYEAGRGSVGFADAYPILVASEASIDDLNSRMESSVPIQRFRPNIILKGCGPFEEDTWSRLQIGKVILKAARPCIRCLVTTQDPLTGELQGPEPLKTLASYRKVPNGVIFGMYYIPEKLGKVSVGDFCIATV